MTKETFAKASKVVDKPLNVIIHICLCINVNILVLDSPCHRSYTARSIPTYAHPSYAAVPDKGRLYSYGITSGTHSDRRHMFYSRASQRPMGCSVCSQLRTSGFPRPHSVSI